MREGVLPGVSKTGQHIMRTAERNSTRLLQLGTGWFSEETAGGGAERYYCELRSVLAKLGWDVHGLVIGSDLVQRETKGKVLAFAPSDASLRIRLLAARRAVSNAIDRCRPDLITSHFAMYALPALDLIRGFPYVVHFHGPWAAEAKAEGGGRFSTLFKWVLESAVYRCADRYVVLSNAFRRILVEDYSVREERVRTVPGGVDAARFAPRQTRAQARERLGWPLDRSIVLTVRRLRARMGLGKLIEAMNEVRRRVPGALLVIAGQGPLRPSLEQFSESLRLEDIVRFAGFVPDADLPMAYRAADIVIMPSLELEGFGLTAVEAMAAGTPTLVTPVGGLPDVVRDLDPGLILEGTTTQQIAEGIIHALQKLSSLPDSERCTEFVRRNYDWPIVARAVHDVYRELL